MQIINKIDHLKSKLTDLRAELTNDPTINQKNFYALLTSSIESNNSVPNETIDTEHSKNNKTDNKILNLTDPNYSFYNGHSRKPNMRQLMEALSGKSLQDLYAEPEESWREISRQSSDILYGVIGPNEDTRDWQSIMSSKDILTQAREQTGAMYEPEVDIQSNFNERGILTEQIAVIKDKKGNILRPLSNNLTYTKETLLDFGATKESIPTNLEDRITPGKFDDDLLAFLKNFDNSPTTIQQVVVQSASEVIANKISQEIPVEELAKL